MSFDRVDENEILQKLKEIHSGKAARTGNRDMPDLLHDDIFQKASTLHYLKDPSSVPRETRMRLMKRVIQRLLKIYTQRQVEYNVVNTDIINTLVHKMQSVISCVMLLEEQTSSLSGKYESIKQDMKVMENSVKAELMKEIIEKFSSLHERIDDEKKTIYQSVESLNRDLNDKYREMLIDSEKKIKEMHGRIEDEKKALFSSVEEARESMATDIQKAQQTSDEKIASIHKRIQDEKDSVFNVIESKIQSMHQHIEDEKKSIFNVLDSFREQTAQKISKESVSFQKQLDEVLKEIHQRIDDEKAGIMQNLPGYAVLEQKTQEAKDHAGRLAEMLDKEIDGVLDKLTPRNIFHLYRSFNDIDDEVYFQLEAHFRGTDEQITERQDFYLNLISDNNKSLGDTKGHYLDAGCGRGELLDLFKRNNIPARGVDSNETMIEYCAKRGLDVVQENANAYLAGLKDNSLRGVTALQVIEHFSIREMFDMFDLSYRKIKPGGILVIETVNPESVYALRWFHMDYTHNKPLPAPLVQFLFSTVGFKDVKIIPRSPVEGWRQMAITNQFELIDQNFHKLNNFLYGFQDYAVTGVK